MLHLKAVNQQAKSFIKIDMKDYKKYERIYKDTATLKEPHSFTLSNLEPDIL